MNDIKNERAMCDKCPLRKFGFKPYDPYAPHDTTKDTEPDTSNLYPNSWLTYSTPK